MAFRFIGGLKGGNTKSGIVFGSPGCPYKSIRPACEGAVLSVMCDRELYQDELPFPITEEDAEDYAREEHQVDIPMTEWFRTKQAPLSIGEFFVCRSPEVLRTSLSRDNTPRTPIRTISHQHSTPDDTTGTPTRPSSHYGTPERHV